MLSIALGLLVFLVIGGVVLWQLSQGVVRQITLSESELELRMLDDATLVCSIYPETAADTEVVWSSSDESIATVTQDGKVHGVKEGTCTVTVAAQDKTASVQITVLKPKVSSVTITGNGELAVGITTQLMYEVLPAQCAAMEVKWRSTNTLVATVDKNGRVTAVGSGICNIYAEVGGVTDRISLFVYDPDSPEGVIVGTWRAEVAYSPEEEKLPEVADMNMSIVFDAKKKGTLFYGNTPVSFSWKYYFQEESICHYILTTEGGEQMAFIYSQDALLMLIDDYAMSFTRVQVQLQ